MTRGYGGNSIHITMNTIHTSDIFGSRSRVAVLGVLANVAVPLSIRQVAVQAGLSHASAGEALDHLVSLGVVASSDVGVSGHQTTGEVDAVTPWAGALQQRQLRSLATGRWCSRRSRLREALRQPSRIPSSSHARTALVPDLAWDLAGGPHIRAGCSQRLPHPPPGLEKGARRSWRA